MEDKKTILVVDDTKLNIEILLDLLGEKYNIIPSLNGEKALKILQKKDIDLILLDIMMPDMDGYEVCREIKKDNKTKDIPVIFITAKIDEDSIEKAYDVGGVDYVTKPFSPREILSRISAHLALSQQRNILEVMRIQLQKENLVLNKEIHETQKEIIFTMGSIGESRSKETGNHVKRVAKYSEILALNYGMCEKEASLLKEASPMHDIGKVAIPDSVLNKPARLTQEEYVIMQEHAQLGYDILKGSKRELLKTAAILAYEHHEKWDGSGYPQGKKGEDIHIYGRITAIADVFDALGSDRVYKKAWDDEKIFNYFKDESGSHFDPNLIDIFFDNLDEILKVRDSLAD
ncbi:MAG: two-component system response regulator [Campylobacterota bacterium]|nr:two-component system response regulator [Campylobacterota bacterium]